MKTIATHSANFHTDDVFGVEALLMYLEKKGEKSKVIRVPFDDKVLGKADYVLDIGKVYDSKKNKFDHHQEGGAGSRSNGIWYATFGLIWKKFGKDLSGSAKVADVVDKILVSYIDADDNGTSTFKRIYQDVPVFTIDLCVRYEANAIANRNIKDKSELYRTYDLKFGELVEWAKKVILVCIEKAKGEVLAEQKAKKIYEKSQDKRIIVMKDFVPYNFGNFPEPLLIVYPDNHGRWSVKTVTEKGELFKGRISLPEEWRGLPEDRLPEVTGVEDAVFCHNSGFLIVALSKEGALVLANKALKLVARD